MNLKPTVLILIGLFTFLGAIPMKMTITLNNDSVIVKELSEIEQIGFSNLSTALFSQQLETSLVPSLKVHHKAIQVTGASKAPFELKMYDLMGRQVFTAKSVFSATGRASIMTPSLANRMYIVQFTTDKKTMVKRINLLK